jgi:hypothetical protein
MPVSKSRHLYAGGRPSSKQVSLGLFPETLNFPGFDHQRTLVSTHQQWFIYIRLFDTHLTHLLRLFLNVHYNGSLPMLLKVV